MNIKTWSNMLGVGLTGLMVISASALAAEGAPQDMKYAANCKVEGADAAQCSAARRALVKYSLHCKMEGPDATTCKQAGDIVKARKLAGQPDVTGAAPSAPTAQKAMTAAPAAAPAAGATAKDDLDIKYALHCKAEGDEASKCMGMRDKVRQYGAHCKEEGADSQRCMTAHKATGMMPEH